MRIAIPLQACALVAGCAWAPAPLPAVDPGPSLHAAGDRVAMVTAHYGVPILQRSLFWDGNGEVDTFGTGLHGLWFASDGVALGLGVDGGVFVNPGHKEYGAEGVAHLRGYPLDGDLQGLFLDGTTGYLQTTDRVPPGGTEWNFTFSFGLGYEQRLSEHDSLLFAFSYHHMSNALGRDNPRNPSQNEGRAWIAYSWDW